ncbi:MAG: hypothetical protein H6760_01500 [Candidatus Nomurabacteria bacterium]|nr:MAG: hypothetical protein H6760_01500 [Candidatus Nomurabacteria bacterium]
MASLQVFVQEGSRKLVPLEIVLDGGRLTFRVITSLGEMGDTEARSVLASLVETCQGEGLAYTPECIRDGDRHVIDMLFFTLNAKPTTS